MNSLAQKNGARTERSLDALFCPRSVAVIGASATPTKIGGLPLAFLKEHGFTGEIFPVNAKADEIQGLRAYRSIRELKGRVDLAIIAVPSAAVETAVEDVIAAEVSGVVLFSSGFAEVGEEGAESQRRIAARLRQVGIRILGPNCLGFMNLRSKVLATFSPVVGQGVTSSGRIGLVSQSGAYGAYAFTLARERGLGLSYWITTGNEADVDFSDCVRWLADDPNTDVILGYMEGCRDGRKLERALDAARRAGKPVVITKVGKTELGAQAAASHTAALAGEDAIYDAVFRKHGVYRAHSLEEFFDVAYAVAVAGTPSGSRAGLFTVSGGAGVLMADSAAELGLEVPELPGAVQQQILDLVPFAAPRNPVDITGQITNDISLLETTMQLMLDSGQYDMMAGFLAAAGLGPMGPVMAEHVVNVKDRFPDHVFAIVSVFKPAVRETLEAGGCLVFEDPSRAMRALSALAYIARGRSTVNAARPDPIPPQICLEPRAYTEPEALDLLRAQGLPVTAARLTRNPDEAARAAAEFGGKVVAKIVSQDVMHKSDVGGVRLGLQGEEEARHAYEQILASAKDAVPAARIEGVLVAPMETGELECIVGVHQDPAFGPVLMLGLGGIFVEAIKDVSLRTAPVDMPEARSMIAELRSAELFRGARGRPAVDTEALADVLVRISQFAAQAGESLEALDINPLLLRQEGQGVVALDALLVGGAGHGDVSSKHIEE